MDTKALFSEKLVRAAASWNVVVEQPEVEKPLEDLTKEERSISISILAGLR